jgi:pimeloyl-ACP methyl ester carboxylesterase
VLQHRYGKSKPVSLFLFSHSFGGALAVNFLVNPANQALVKGWINVDGAVDYVRNDTATQNILIKTGREQIALGKNVEEWEKYVQYALNNDPRSSIKVADQLEAYASRAQYLMEELNPENYGVKKIVENNKPYSISSQLVNKFTAWNHLSKELINFSPTQEQLANVSLPVLQIYGRYDFNVPLSLGRHLDKNISTSASQKSLMIFEHSAHNPFASEPDLFYSNVLAFIGQYK